MANARYPLGMKALMDGSIPFLTADLNTTTGLPYTQNGGNVNVAVHASGLLSIA